MAVDDILFYARAGALSSGDTFTRSGSVGPYIGKDGVVQSASADRLRVTWRDDDGDLVHDTPYLVLARALTNAIDSDDLTAWTASGTPVVAATDGPDGSASSAYNVEDDDGAATEYIERVLSGLSASPSNKGITFTIRENTMPASGNQQLVLRDTTAAADRLVLNITGWTNGEPSITAATGALLETKYVGNGYWFVAARCTSLTVANSNRIRIVPAVTAAQTGIIDVYRVNVFDEDYPDAAPYDASETKNAETLYTDFTHVPRAMTVYTKFVELGTAFITTAGIVHIGAASGGADPRFDIYRTASGQYRVEYDNGSAFTNADITAGNAVAYGDVVELLATLGSDGSVSIAQSVNGGAVTTVVTGSAPSGGLAATWAAERLYIGSSGASAHGTTSFESVKIARGGAKTMAEMRSLRPYFIVNNTAIPVSPGVRSDTVEMGDRSRTFDGTLRETIRSRVRTWDCDSAPLTLRDAQLVRDALNAAVQPQAASGDMIESDGLSPDVFTRTTTSQSVQSATGRREVISFMVEESS